jgi:hypothetical protein
MNESEEGETTWETPPYRMIPFSSKIGRIETMHAGVSPNDSIRDTRPILEDSIREDLKAMTDEELRAVWNWSNSWTTDHVSAVKRWVARGPINDEMQRRRETLIDFQSPLRLPDSSGESKPDT